MPHMRVWGGVGGLGEAQRVTHPSTKGCLHVPHAGASPPGFAGAVIFLAFTAITRLDMVRCIVVNLVGALGVTHTGTVERRFGLQFFC